MARNFTLLLLFFGAFIGNAQDSLKARAKSISTELNVNPFQGSLSFNNTLQQIKVRYFKTDEFAYRIAFIGSYHQSDSKTNLNSIGADFNDSRRTSTLGLNFGFENHFKGTRRLSPYVGAELSLAFKSSKEIITDTNYRREITGGWINDTVTGNGTYTPPYNESSYFRFGANFVSGFDYYPAKNFYFGYEFIFQIYEKNNADVHDLVGSSNYGSMKGSSEFFIGPNLINGIRLGYIF